MAWFVKTVLTVFVDTLKIRKRKEMLQYWRDHNHSEEIKYVETLREGDRLIWHMIRAIFDLPIPLHDLNPKIFHSFIVGLLGAMGSLVYLIN